MNKIDKCEPIMDVDITKRFPDEWARINGIQIRNLPAEANYLMNEYEFAWYLPNFNYFPMKKDKDGMYDFDSIADKEMRLSFIRRDLFYFADFGERDLLEKKYIETEWVRKNILRIWVEKFLLFFLRFSNYLIFRWNKL